MVQMVPALDGGIVMLQIGLAALVYHMQLYQSGGWLLPFSVSMRHLPLAGEEISGSPLLSC